jgi:hypothetical protein
VLYGHLSLFHLLNIMMRSYPAFSRNFFWEGGGLGIFRIFHFMLIELGKYI